MLERFVPVSFLRREPVDYLPTTPLAAFVYHNIGTVFWLVAILAAIPVMRASGSWRGTGDVGRVRELLHAGRGRRSAAAHGRADKPTVTLLGEMFPADPVGIGMLLEPMGLAAGPVVPTREWRELYGALDCAAVAAIHPFYTASHPRVRCGGPPGRRLRPGRASTAPRPGSRRSARACSVAPAQIDAAKNACLPAIRGALGGDADQRPHHRVGLRRLRAAGRAAAGRERRRGALCRHRLPAHARGREADRDWLEAHGRRTCSTAPRSSRTSRRCSEFKPDLAIGTTPVVQKAKELGDPGALLHQPDLGAAAVRRRRRRLAGAGHQRGASPTSARFDAMSDFFDGVGEGDAAGVWARRAERPPGFRERNRKAARGAGAKTRKAEEMV